MADCSKTEVFLAEWRRMHYTIDYCEKCHLDHDIKQTCLAFVTTNPKKSVEAVQKWSNEHPEQKPKTYADDFFEKHPNAPKRANGMPMAFRCQVYGCSCGKHEANMINGCEMCWNEPYEGSEQ